MWIYEEESIHSSHRNPERKGQHNWKAGEGRVAATTVRVEAGAVLISLHDPFVRTWASNPREIASAIAACELG